MGASFREPVRHEKPPRDQRIARILVKPLAARPITPNQVTVATLVIALARAGYRPRMVTPAGTAASAGADTSRG